MQKASFKKVFFFVLFFLFAFFPSARLLAAPCGAVDPKTGANVFGTCGTVPSCSGVIYTPVNPPGPLCAPAEICCVASPQNTVGTPIMAGSYANPLAISGTAVTDVPTLLLALLLFFQRIIVILAVVFIIIGALIYITSAGNENRVTWAKRAILAAVIGLALAIAAPLFLREIGAILGWASPSPNLGAFGTQLTLTQVLGNILSFLLGILGVVGLLGLILGAFMYLTSAGDTDRADTGKKIITYSIIGIVVALAGLVIIRQVATFF